MNTSVRKTSVSARDITMAAMGVALIAVCSWISVPLTVPFTLQTFAVCLIASLFGLRSGVRTVVCYLLLGAIGVPVFAGFRGGIGALLGVTGGYLVGFLFTAIAVGFAADHWGRRPVVLIPSMILGILLCYLFGTGWFVLVYTKSSGPISVASALALCVLPYIPADAAKAALASLLAVRLYPLFEGRHTS